MKNDEDNFEYSESTIKAAIELNKLLPKEYLKHQTKLEEAKIRRSIDKMVVDQLAEKRLENEQLENGLLKAIPKGRKWRRVKKMASLIHKGKAIESLTLARCIKSSLSRTKYKQSPKQYDNQVRNTLRILKKYWKKLGYTVKFIRFPVKGYQLVLIK